MKAVQLIREADFCPEQLAVIEDALEQSWAAVEARFSDRHSRENARLRLASITLLVARVITDAELLKSAALRAFLNGKDL